jgi:hypothetical protein
LKVLIYSGGQREVVLFGALEIVDHSMSVAAAQTAMVTTDKGACALQRD